MASPKESNSQCLKRKLVDDCLSKDCKFRRIKSENGPSLDSSAKRCNSCCTRPNLANDCVNFLKSGVPNRIMYYKQGSWHNFPQQIMKSLIEEFKGNKSSVVAVMDDEPLLIDFLSMTLVNLKTRRQRSVAWFDDSGKCFFPSIYFDEDSDELTKGVSGSVDKTSQGIMLHKVANSPPEVVKQVVLESSSPVPQNPCTADILRKKITSVERGSEGFLFVQNLFLSGMGSFASPSSILHVHRYSPNDITAQCRLEAFERQMKSTKEQRGDANVRYGWLGSRKNDIVRILINGLGTTVEPADKASLSAGVYLSPENRAFTSVGLCGVDEKGVQYMLLCRVILGNMEPVEPGSQETFPSSEMYDSGVDDCSNPKCYVMWPSHLNTHMRLEYLVSFKLIPKVQNYLLGLKGLWFHSAPKDGAVDIPTLQPIMSETGEGPTSPWISFKVLFGVIQENISPVARELLFHHYEELKESKITREEMVKMMIIIIGEKILLEALKKLHYCPSLWYKPPVEAAPGDPGRATQEQLSLDETGNNCSLTLSVNHGGSHAPNAMVEHLPVHSTKGCDNLITEMVACLAPAPSNASKTHGNSASGSTAKGCESVVPSLAFGIPKSNGVKRLSSSSRLTPEAKGFLSLGIASQGPAVHTVKGQDSLTPAAALSVHASGRGNSRSISSEDHVSLALSFSPKGYDGSASSKTLKRHESLRAGKLPEIGCSQARDVVALRADKLPEIDRSQARDAVAKVYNASTSITGEPKDQTGVHGSQNKTLKRHESLRADKLPEIGHSQARGAVALRADKLPEIGRSQARDASALRADKLSEIGRSQALDALALRADKLPEIGRPQAQDAVAKVYNASTSITGEPKDQTGVHGSQNKSSGASLDASSSVAGAASALVALSTPREKGGR